MLTRHELTCQRPGCGRRFTATRRDARYCSRGCRRRRDPPSPMPAREADAVPADDLDGWRRVGRYVIPPADSRYTAFVDPDVLRRL
jgi:hypothetical protein